MQLNFGFHKQKGGIFLKSEIKLQRGCERDKISPFIMYPNMRYEKVRKKDCSNADIKQMFVERSITETDDMVLKSLSKYGCLNSYLLRRYMYHISGGRMDYDCTHMRRVLKELIKRGMVIQYELFHWDNESEQGSPFLYTLSAGGKRYLRKQGILEHHPFLSMRFTIKEVLSLMASNQFHIMFLCQYGLTTLFKRDDYYGECYKKAGMANFYMLNDAGSNMYLFLVAVRSCCQWLDNYLASLIKLKEYAKELEIEKYILLAVCETEYQAMECARAQYEVDELNEMNVYYITDTAIVSEKKVFDRLIEVSVENGKSKRSTFRLAIAEAE